MWRPTTILSCPPKAAKDLTRLDNLPDEKRLTYARVQMAVKGIKAGPIRNFMQQNNNPTIIQRCAAVFNNMDPTCHWRGNVSALWCKDIYTKMHRSAV